MIFHWLYIACVWIARLFIPAPPRRKKIDPNAPCPSCGAEKGEIQTVRIGSEHFVKHRCDTCKVYWYETPLSKAYKLSTDAEERREEFLASQLKPR